MLRRHLSLFSLAAVLALLAGVLLVARGIDISPAAADPSGQTPAWPAELTAWRPDAANPLFTGAGPGHWDAKIRERGWILREADGYHLWYTGYDGTKEGIKRLGYATSPDGVHWQRWPGNPLLADDWVEDVMIVKHAGVYYMFAEGRDDQAQLLTSTDRVHWQLAGRLDVRRVDGQPIAPGPFGTPVAWFERGVWYLFYERMDQGIWLATSRDLKVWTNVQDEPVFTLGPEPYDSVMIAFDQIVKRDGWFYALYHATGDKQTPRVWSTDLARSRDLVHWHKYPGNPILNDKSSPQWVFDGRRLRLYTMHDRVDLFLPPGP